MSWRVRAWVAAVVLVAASLHGQEPAADTPDPHAVNEAIDRGVVWLRAAQHADGSWGPCVSGGNYGSVGGGGPCYFTGPTAFATFALATCGVPRKDPGLRRARKWLDAQLARRQDHASYEFAAIVLMLTALNGTRAPADGKLPRAGGHRRPPGVAFRDDDWKLMHECLQRLNECASPEGGFCYWPGEGPPDASQAQFAALAFRMASFAGYPVEKLQPDLWHRLGAFVRGLQDGSGGFPYHAPYKPTRGMTAAALSTLLICREQMGLLGEEVDEWVDPAIGKGFDWLDANFDVAANPSPHFKDRSHYHYCHLYAIERTGVLSGRRELGGKSWYGRGAAFLLRRQREDGAWRDSTCMDPEDVLGSCFALLFLKKATFPAVTPR